MNTNVLEGYRLSAQQLYYWRWLESGHELRIQGVIRIKGALESRILKTALQHVVDRHEILRTSFHAAGEMGGVLQAVAQDCGCALTELDLQSESLMDQACHSEWKRPFDYQQGPLLHALLVRLPADEQRVVLTLPALCADACTVENLLRELASNYRAVLAGVEPAQDEELVQYADYAQWQEELREGAEGAEGREYWHEQRARNRVVRLGIEERGENSDQEETHEVEVWLTSDDEREIGAAATAEGVSASTLLQAAWQALLWRHSNNEEIAVDVSFDGRKYEYLVNAVGSFAQHLPVSCRFADQSAFNTILSRTKEANERAEEWQDYYSAQHGEASSSESRIGFEYQSWSRPQRAGDLRFELVKLSSNRGPFKLKLIVQQQQRGIRLELQYDAQFFSRRSVERLLEEYVTLLKSGITQRQALVRDLQMVGKHEREELLYIWNQTEREYRCGVTLQELFEEQVQRTPRAIAVRYETEALSYEELNERANQIARRLRSLGVETDQVVGICLERSLGMVAAIFGVLKAGGAYLPLDPDYPRERLEYMLADARVKVLVSEEQLVEGLSWAGGQTICIERDWKEISQLECSNLEAASEEGNLAYVLYTSGSTGQPKGVGISQAAIVNHMHWFQERFELGADDRVLQKTPFSFDASVWEFFGPLLSGGELVMARPGGQREPEYLVETIKHYEVSILQVVPTLLRALAATEGLRECVSLRLLFSGGEELKQELVEQVQQQLAVPIYNLYGPTEASIDTTCGAAVRGKDREQVKLGRPIENLEVYVLDEQQELVPVGVAGELYIGGAGLARGYYGRPAETAEKFLPHRYSRQAGARLYRTGDRGRYLGDGQLEYLGRLDQQVKVRGYRIELGEIEAVLRSHAGVRESVVVSAAGVRGEQKLVGYVVGSDDVSGEELRRYVAAQLPEYMVPEAIEVVQRWPLTPSGKVDRAALAASYGERAEREYVAPQTATERQLGEIWATLLKVPQVGVEDNFFALGGDSILSLQMVARARAKGLQLTPKQVFQYQTLGALALQAESAAQAMDQAASKAEESGTAPLTPIQRQFFRQQRPEPSHYNQAVLLQVPVGSEVEELRQAVALVVQHHEALRLRFREVAAGEWEQWLAEQESNEVFTHYELEGLTDAEQRQKIEATAEQLQRSLNLAAGPLLRVAYFSCGAQKGRLLVIVHHLVVDGVSWRILLEDLAAVRAQLAAGKEAGAVELPARTTSYQQWARQLQQYAGSAALQDEVEYWQEVAAAARRQRGEERESGAEQSEGGTQQLLLNREQTRALLQQVPEIYHTQIQEVLLTALGRAWERWSGRGQVVVEMEGHGREEVVAGLDLTRTVGWFTSLYPVVLRSRAGEERVTALKRVKEQLRSVPQRGAGYGVLKELSEPAELRERLAVESDVSFNYLGQFDQVLGEQGVWEHAGESVGQLRGESGGGPEPLAVTALVGGGQLQVNWAGAGAVAELVQSFEEELLGIIEDCASGVGGGYTPSDFPHVQLSQAQVDQITLGRGEVEDIYRLTAMQDGLLFHTLYAPQGGAYFVQLSYEIEGALSVPALKEAWQQVIARHEVLRSSFVWEGFAEPLQVVQRGVSLPVKEYDWSELPAAEQAERLSAYQESERREGFALGEAPLMKLSLMRLGEQRYYLNWSHHHILLDGWCTAIVLQEVFTCYDSLRQGQQVTLARRRPYRSYVKWLQQQDLGAAEQYWRERLRGFSGAPALPLSRPGAEWGAGRYTEREIEFSEAATERLKAVGRSRHLTLNTLVEGAWALLLSRYWGEDDVVFGITVAGRPVELPDAEKIVGLFINTLPLRVAVATEQPVWAWLAELQQQQAEMQSYEYTPLVQVQGWSEVERGTPLFETIFVFENYPVEPPRHTPGGDQTGVLKLLGMQVKEQNNYALSFKARPGQRLVLNILFDQQLYEARSIERMLGHMQLILDALATDEEQSLSALPLMTAAEREQVLHSWNQTQQDYPRDLTLQLLFEQQVERTPNQIAIVFDKQQLSYAELNFRANQLAHYLRSAGVGPEVPVGICMERSMEMVVALLGTLKAGGAYLPLDPSYPQERLSFMIDNTQVKVVLTQQRLAGTLTAKGAQLVCLDADATLIEQQSSENPNIPTMGDNLAYVIYTSGSTGQPKGAGISQAAIVNHMQWILDRFELGADDRVFQKSPFSFDASVWEIFGPLLCGGVLVLARPGGHQDPEYLLATIKRYGVTVLQVVPTLLRALVATGGLRECVSLRLLFTGGEELTQELVEQVQEQLAVTHYNLYGPTETTIDNTHWPCERGVRQRIVPLGRPISNNEIYILDKTGQPVPAGVRGELHVAGIQLARGYFQRADLTAEKFIPNQFSRQPGERLYRSGDAVRYLEDGTIEFLGRLDYQLKVRGFRIELGEIESVLMKHPLVREAVVVALESGPGDKQLVAYIVAEPGESLSVADLRLHLKNIVPDYMVPAAFVILDQMPLTPSGKVDRKALPAPPRTPITQPDYVAPRNVVEEILAGIWCEVLNVGQVGVNDDFFELGGHSLLAMQVISRAREALGVDVGIHQLFESPTIAEFAADIESNMKGEQAGMPLLERVSREQALPLSFEQRRLWFLNKLEPESPFYNMSYGVRLTGELDLGALELTLSEIIRRHETLRTCFVEMDGEPQQFILPATHVHLEVQDLTALSEEEWQAEVQHIAGQTARQPFDLNAGPLRMKLLRGGDSQHVLLVTIHHIASDGWSLGILTREVATLYDGYRQGQQSSLPELPIQYADFAVWQRNWLEGEALDSQLAYWRQQLASVPSVLELPTDRLRPAVQSFHGAYEGFNLPSELSEGLWRLSRREGVTLFMSLLAAWQILLSRYAGQEDVVVGTPIANRNRKETEGLIGFFVNTLVLRTDLSGDPTFCEVLKRVRQITLGAYAHQDLPFEKLVEELQPERTLSHSPLFQVMFTLQNAPAEVLQLSGLTLSGVNAETAPIRFDLSLTMQERPEAITGALGYNLDLFDKPTIRKMIAHFKQLLEVVVANNEQPLSTLSFVSEAEQQLINEWNTTDAAFPQAARLSELFEWQAAETPGALAVIFEDVQLTYAELNQRANRLAHYLQGLGVGPQILVGLYLESPLETVIGMLAVLKAGGAYVPLDSQSPPDRLAFMIADARLPFVLTQQTILPLLPESQAQIICLDSGSKRLAAYSGENPICPATALSVAYLIYTSGSTGEPKAVLVEHRNAVNLIHASARKFGFTATDVMPVLASFAFDISLFELMAPLTTGGTVVLTSRAEVMDLPRLAQIVERCTMLHMVPSLMRQFLNVLETRDAGRRYERLRQIFIGGDAVPPDVLSKMAEMFPQARVEVLYGPTETTLFCTSLEVTPAEADPRLVIGRPLPNVKIRICDQHQTMLPIGMAGEICIGGAGVTRGYLSQDQLTKEKFPIIDGRRYYRSGDRGRYLPDGRIEFLGRVDDQIKIRGFRVEPGEVAAALNFHPAVHEAVVVALPDQRSEKRLVAYVVPEGELEVAQLREYLQQRLPSYMVPAAFVMLDEIPLTLNGKLDKRRLPLPEQAGANGEREYVEPKTEIEKGVAEIFAQVLDLERVDCSESFFDMGGHSLLATQVISRIAEVFDVELPLRCIFESPTVVELSIAIEAAAQANELQSPSRPPEIIRLNRDAYQID